MIPAKWKPWVDEEWYDAAEFVERVAFMTWMLKQDDDVTPTSWYRETQEELRHLDRKKVSFGRQVGRIAADLCAIEAYTDESTSPKIMRVMDKFKVT